MAFKPKGEYALRVQALEALRAHSVGETVPYAELEDLLGTGRKQVQAAVRAAAPEFLDVDQQAVEAVPNVGYRIVPASDHVRLAQGLQRRSSRALVRGHAVVTKVDFATLSPEVRALTEATARAFAVQIDFNRRMDVRQERLEAAIDAVSAEQNRSADEVAELRERLARLERQIDPND